MKYNVLCLFLLLAVLTCNAQSSFYNLELQAIDGTSVNAASLKKKVVLIATVDAANVDTIRLKQLRTIFTGYKDSAVLLLVPVLHFSNTAIADRSVFVPLLSNLADKNIKVLSVADKSNIAGYALLKWLSGKEQNGHFQLDFKQPYQILFVNNKGAMYGNLIPASCNEKIINRTISLGLLK